MTDKTTTEPNDSVREQLFGRPLFESLKRTMHEQEQLGRPIPGPWDELPKTWEELDPVMRLAFTRAGTYRIPFVGGGLGGVEGVSMLELAWLAARIDVGPDRAFHQKLAEKGLIDPLTSKPTPAARALLESLSGWG